ncbi:MAG: GGDEF domain-containing protein [Candidatus Omnitrophota bacterium]
MPFVLILLLLAVFTVIAIFCSGVAVRQLEQQVEAEVLRVREAYQQIARLKESQAAEKAMLQETTNRLFNLYDLMRELTRAADAREGFGIFKEHLNRQLVLDDCQLVEYFPKDIADFPSFKGYRFFPLKAKKMVLGELAYKGLLTDEESFSILAQQFALALRRIRLYKDLEGMAIKDGLTQLYTRRYMTERFAEEFGRARLQGLALSLLMIDVDHFKKVNDQDGHLAGDMVLKEVGRIILEQTREVDITGRYGGEEFCVILPDTDKAGALIVAERIRAAVQTRRIKAYDKELSVTVSIGISTAAEDAQQMEELLDKADAAMYRAKKAGRNRVVGYGALTKET